MCEAKRRITSSDSSPSQLAGVPEVAQPHGPPHKLQEAEGVTLEESSTKPFSPFLHAGERAFGLRTKTAIYNPSDNFSPAGAKRHHSQWPRSAYYESKAFNGEM